MDRLNDRILALHPIAIPDVDFLLYHPPGEEVGIYNWNETKLGPQPSDADLASVKLQPMAVVSPRLSFREFIRLFTKDEQLGIAQAAMTDAATKLWYDQAVGAEFIDLGDADLAAGLDALVSAKLITAARKVQVLAGATP
ncbi:hypothetical protein [Bosea sp. UNC402CLCol]|uniref:hypothetical protein n=1 Tax=Bosea sp. UNC402CLCol TaxID=1510531 RepID=UPI00056E4255|nr:hypothetical protein [Bosea sp. UNC402CLCol]